MFHVPEASRIQEGPLASTSADGNNGLFQLRRYPGGAFFWVIASSGGGWEHVSCHVSADPRGKHQRIPDWEEMCWLKSVFWDPEDVVMQLHPRQSEFVNEHAHTLHLWRPTEGEIPTPPTWMVGHLRVPKRHG